eukprot:scaffold226191_cov29-Prasinocladus_malaysianus.AAC.1
MEGFSNIRDCNDELQILNRLDMEAARSYCEADERWQRAVEFLDAGTGAGWDLLQAMLNKDWRKRPTAESCLNHPFLNGKSLNVD